MKVKNLYRDEMMRYVGGCESGDNRLSEDEAKFWIEAAKKEYFYTAQRDIKYEPQDV